MSSLVVAGDTSGSVTISAPAIAGSTTLTLPSSSGSGLLLNTSMNLLGTITVTASNSVSLTGLNLTPYKQIQFVMKNVDCGATNQFYISADNSQTNVNGKPTASPFWVINTIDLATGVISGGVLIAFGGGGGGAPTNAGYIGYITNITTSSTAIYFRLSSTNTWTASGTITVYGVY